MEELMHAEQSAQAPVPAAEKKKKRKLFRGGKKRRWCGRLSCGAWARLPVQGFCIRR